MKSLPELNNPEVKLAIDKELEKGAGMELMMTRMKNSIICHVLSKTEGNISRAADLLKVHRNNLVRWIRDLEENGTVLD